jgi:hypothetical protein
VIGTLIVNDKSKLIAEPSANLDVWPDGLRRYKTRLAFMRHIGRRGRGFLTWLPN